MHSKGQDGQPLIDDVITKLKGGLIVSAQASDGEPLAAPEHICALALSGLNGGATGLRLEGADNIAYLRKRTPAPIIGLVKSTAVHEKDRLKSVYITATYQEAAAVAKAGADVVALDATGRPRADGLSLPELVNKIREELGLPVWADVATYEQGLAAAEAGADVVSTTLFGYTEETEKPADHEPDFDLLARLCRDIKKPVVLEGRVWHPSEVKKAFELGAYAVVVGSAITRPQLITKRFVKAIPVLS